MKKALNLLGLCARAGFVRSGEAACEQAVKRGEAFLMLADEGASRGALKSARDACAYAGIECLTVPAGELGAAVGKPGRMTVAILDRGFAAKVAELIKTHMERGGAVGE